MPDRELVLRERCPCPDVDHRGPVAGTIKRDGEWVPINCPGGSETVLDPERWLRLYCRLTEIRSILVKVQDVIDALGGSDE